jgi:large subunit ribosomal protein L15
MKFNELTQARQSKPTRAGRGISAGRGKTAGRGTKGQGSRKSPLRAGFEGGQMPLYMRLPKLRGFKSQHHPAETVYIGQLDKIKKTAVDANELYAAGLISSPYVKVKLLHKGELAAKKDVKLTAASTKAQAVIEKAGGTFTSVDRQARPKKQPEKS